MTVERQPSSWYIVASIVCLFVAAPLTHVIEEEIVGPRLVNGTIVELGRYTFIYDAVDYLDSKSEATVLAVGSSKMREGFDGGLLDKESAARGVIYANLGVAADVPYFRMTNIEAIANLQPDVVVLELGPNSLSALGTPLKQQDIDRMNAMLYNRPINLKRDFELYLDEEDTPLLNLGAKGWANSKSDMGFEAIEDALPYKQAGVEEEARWDCSNPLSNVRCVPSVESPLFPAYLEHPPQFSNAIEYYKSLGPEALAEFYGPKLDAYLATPYHQPEGTFNKNEQALEFIIDELVDEGVNVLLLGLPYNPVLENRLSPGDWDYYNTTVERFGEDARVHMLDLMWDPAFDDEALFNDFTHMSDEGERRLMQVLAPEIDALLASRGVSMVSGHTYTPIPTPTDQPTIYAAELPATGTVHVNLSKPNKITSGYGLFNGHTWEVDPQSGWVTSTPEADVSQNGVSGSPQIEYCMNSTTSTTYWVWLLLYPSGGRSDSVYVGLDGELLDVGRRGVQSWEGAQKPVWRSVGDNGNRIFFSSSGEAACLNIWVREDGVVIRDIVITTDEHLVMEA